MKKVLLASASRVFLKRNSNLLMGRGLQLFTATSGANALKLQEEYHFDLILSDLRLEEMSGCTLCSLLRKGEDSRHVPVILICHNIPGSIERVEQSCASAILLKPVDPIRLLETVGSFINEQIGRNRRVVLHVKVTSKKSDLDFLCFSHDISNTGILLETEYQLPLGSRIICHFTLPGSCTIETEGEVVRFMTASECENLYGVKFIALSSSHRTAIDDYINSIADSVVGTQDAGSHPR